MTRCNKCGKKSYVIYTYVDGYDYKHICDECEDIRRKNDCKKDDCRPDADGLERQSKNN